MKLGDWLKNTEGKSPVSVGTKTEVRLGGYEHQERGQIRESQNWSWEVSGFNGEITHYRVLPDADGWIENSGVMPVTPTGVLVDTKWYSLAPEYGHEAEQYTWRIGHGITHWRFHQEEKPLEPPRVLRLSEQVALLEDFKASLSEENTALKLEIVDLKAKLEAIRGLV